VKKINKTYMILGIINFVQISRMCFVTLYKSLVRSHLEYASSLWHPKRKTNVDKFKRVRKRAIPELPKNPYKERLKILNLPTLKHRRYRGNMIELFKVIKGIYDLTCVPHVDFMELSEDLIRATCRGNKFKLIQHHCH